MKYFTVVFEVPDETDVDSILRRSRMKLSGAPTAKWAEASKGHAFQENTFLEKELDQFKQYQNADK